jgi:hypothetical protein
VVDTPPRTSDKIYTVKSILLDTVDFDKQYTQNKLFLSRDEIWRMMYPLSTGIFFIIMSIPVYESVSTVSLCIGLFTKGIYDDIQRGRLWRRPMGRSVMFVLLSVTGVISCILVFIVGYSISVVLTNQAWHENKKYLNVSMPILNDSAKYQEYTNLTYTPQKYQPQYNTWTFNSYAAKTFITWVMSFLAPFLLSNTPKNVALPIVLEFVLPSVTGIAISVQCIVCIITKTAPFSLLNISNPIGDIFFIIAPFMIICTLFIMIYYVHTKKILSLCIFLIPVTFAKMCVVHQDLINIYKLNTTCIITGVIISIYVLTNIAYDMEENKAIRSGWGDDCDSETEEFGTIFQDVSHSTPPENFTIDEETLSNNGET